MDLIKLFMRILGINPATPLPVLGVSVPLGSGYTVPLRVVTLVRAKTGPFGTFGLISADDFSYPTLERPATGDHPCIPAGTYNVNWTSDGRHPEHNPCYEVMYVPGRTAILIHAANVFEELLGCIAPGLCIENMDLVYDGHAINHLGVSSSGPALKDIVNKLDRKNFVLIIKETK